MSIALITGITGQDGSYLAELLLDKGYSVHGIIRRSSSFNTGRIDGIRDRLVLHYGDITDGSSLLRILCEVRPDEIYNLAAQSHVAVSFSLAEYTADAGFNGFLRLLECVRAARLTPRIYQACSSEMFGNARPWQSEKTPFEPQSQYAVAKVAAYHLSHVYRQAYGMFVANGILFNHESPRRGETFVTRKITRAVGRIRCGLQDKLVLGNLDAKRDWGFAGEYVEAMWRMLQRDTPGDFVIGTGHAATVAEFCEAAFAEAGLDWTKYVVTDPRYLRPAEVHHLQADISKANHELGWLPKVTWRELARMMVAADTQLAQREKILLDAGHG